MVSLTDNKLQATKRTTPKGKTSGVRWEGPWNYRGQSVRIVFRRGPFRIRHFDQLENWKLRLRNQIRPFGQFEVEKSEVGFEECVTEGRPTGRYPQTPSSDQTELNSRASHYTTSRC